MDHIRCRQVTKSFGPTQILNKVDLNIAVQEQVVIRGASGSGKSTLLYLLGGMDRPNSGEIWIHDFNLAQASDDKLAQFRNREVGFVFQFHFLLPSMSCLENILLPARIGAGELTPVRSRAEAWAKQLDVAHCLEKYPYQVSGGEQQRINLLRALSLKPKLLLCDEPTGNLDSKNSTKVVSLLKEMAQETKSTLIVVTHDQNVANEFPRKIVIEDGQIIG